VSINSTQATLAWRNAISALDTLTVTNLTDGSTQTVVGQEGQQAFAELRNLAPDTDYSWELESGHSNTVLRSGEFTTLPSEPARNFAVVGHTHGSEHFDHYSDHLLAARIADAKPQFVIHAGDCVYYSTPRSWKEDFFKVFRPVLKRAPVYISPGNHDSGWPFVDGLDLRTFQELFPHAYPKEIQGSPAAAYYSVVQGPVHFLFLSYVSDLSPTSQQHAWIRNTLRSSSSEFRVVVLGGANNYYDKEAFSQLLAEESVDAVLMGDGPAPKRVLSQPSTYPVFTLGTAGGAPHPWLSAKATPEYLTFRQMDATGKASKVHWIHSKRRRAEVLVLGEPTLRPKKNHTTLVYKLAEPISSEAIKGLQFEIEGITKGRLIYYVMAKPKERLSKGEPGFRSQYGSLSPKDKLVAVPIPSERPIRGGTYKISEVLLNLPGTDRHPNIKVKRAWLY
jgi:predicted secreted protein